jgi:hypothetical protein
MVNVGFTMSRMGVSSCNGNKTDPLALVGYDQCLIGMTFDDTEMFITKPGHANLQLPARSSLQSFVQLQPSLLPDGPGSDFLSP